MYSFRNFEDIKKKISPNNGLRKPVPCQQMVPIMSMYPKLLQSFKTVKTVISILY